MHLFVDFYRSMLVAPPLQIFLISLSSTEYMELINTFVVLRVRSPWLSIRWECPIVPVCLCSASPASQLPKQLVDLSWKRWRSFVITTPAMI